MSNDLLNNINKLHTTRLSTQRIRRNLNLKDNINILNYCKLLILNKNALIYREGKNYYVNTNNFILTINASTYTIITAH